MYKAWDTNLNYRILKFPKKIEEDQEEIDANLLPARTVKYVPPKRQSVEFTDSRTKQDRDKERLQARAKRSRIAKFLQEEFGDTPIEESLKDVTEEDLEIQRQAVLDKEYEKVEQETMTRIVRPKKDRKKKSRSFMDPFSDLADFAPLQYMKELSQGSEQSKDNNKQEEDQKFSKVLNKRLFDQMDVEAGKKRKTPVQPLEDSTGNEDQEPRNKKRRRLSGDSALAEHEQEQEQAEDDELYKQVQELQKAKKAQRAQSLTLSAAEEGEDHDEQEDGKRKVSDQIEKNRGLRKKNEKRAQKSKSQAQTQVQEGNCQEKEPSSSTSGQEQTLPRGNNWNQNKSGKINEALSIHKFDVFV